MTKTNCRSLGRRYRGNYWAIVLGHKDKDVIPWPILQYIRTPNKKRLLEEYRAKPKWHCRRLRAIPQPFDGTFEPGM